MSFEIEDNEGKKVEMRFIISKSARQIIDAFKKQYGIRTYAAAINQLIMEYDKLQKQNETAHSIDDVLQMLDKVFEKLSSLEKSITAQIEQQQCCKKIYKVQIQARGKR